MYIYSGFYPRKPNAHQLPDRRTGVHHPGPDRCEEWIPLTVHTARIAIVDTDRQTLQLEVWIILLPEPMHFCDGRYGHNSVLASGAYPYPIHTERSFQIRKQRSSTRQSFLLSCVQKAGRDVPIYHEDLCHHPQSP